MASEADIVNLAAGRLGHTQLIASLSDSGILAAKSRTLYPQVRDRVLELYEFPWATRIAALPASAVEIPGWSYVYSRPIDCLFIDAVCDESGARAWALPLSYNDRRREDLPTNPYRQFDSAAGTVIACDVEDAYAVMRWRVTDTRRFPELFVSALAWELATELAPFLKVRQDLIQLAFSMAGPSLAQASAAALEEGAGDEPPDPPSVRARR